MQTASRASTANIHVFVSVMRITSGYGRLVFPLDQDGLLDPPVGAEDAEIPLDLARQSDRLVGIVGELDGWPAVRLHHLADQRDRLERVVAFRRAVLEIVGQ